VHGISLVRRAVQLLLAGVDINVQHVSVCWRLLFLASTRLHSFLHFTSVPVLYGHRHQSSSAPYSRMTHHGQGKKKETKSTRVPESATPSLRPTVTVPYATRHPPRCWSPPDSYSYSRTLSTVTWNNKSLFRLMTTMIRARQGNQPGLRTFEGNDIDHFIFDEP
jgi:hypothetical protein